AGSNQIADGSTLTVLSSGKYDLSDAQTYGSEIQLITLPVAGGTFTLSMFSVDATFTTGATAADTQLAMQTALTAAFGPGNTVVTPVDSSNNQSFIVTLAGKLANANVPLFSLKQGVNPVANGVSVMRDGAGNAIQQITPNITNGTLGIKFNNVGPSVPAPRAESQRLAIDITSSNNSAFTLTLNGVTTAPITFLTTNTAQTQVNIQNALDAAFPRFTNPNTGSLFTVATVDDHHFDITAVNELANTNLPAFTVAGIGNSQATGSISTNVDGSGNEIQTLDVTGASSVTLTVLGTASTTPIQVLPAINEVERLTFNATNAATDGSQLRLQFNGTLSSLGSILTFQAGNSPKAAEVFQALQTIPDLFDS